MLNRFKRAQEPEPFKVEQFQVNPAARQQQQVSSAPSSRQSLPYFPNHYGHQQYDQQQQLAKFSSGGGGGDRHLGGLSGIGGGGGTTAAIAPASAAAASAAAAAADAPLCGYSIGQGLSTYVPPEWAVDPKPGVFYLEVIKDGTILDNLVLDKKRTLFGRQAIMCDIVLDHPSVSRQHAVIVHHKNGSVYVIDLGSAHGTFFSNERLVKDNPTELEVGCSVRFAASTRSYILRRNGPLPGALPDAAESGREDIELPALPDPEDEEAVLAYNTVLNRWSIPVPDGSVAGAGRVEKERSKNGIMRESPKVDENGNRPVKRIRKARVSFRDDYGGELALVVGISDGADVGTDVGPVGIKEGSTLVGKYESLVKSTIIPHGQDLASISANLARKETGGGAGPAITNRLKQFLDKSLRLSGSGRGMGGLYGDLYENLPPGKAGTGRNAEEEDEDNRGNVGTTSGSVDGWRTGEESLRARGGRSDGAAMDDRGRSSNAEDDRERGTDRVKEKGAEASYGGGSGGHRKYPVEKCCIS